VKRLVDQGVSCSTCIFLSRGNRAGNKGGQCRKNAPVLFIREGKMPSAIWPLVYDDWWCGEHATLEEDTEQ